MSNWNNLHKDYKDQDWINKPNIFASEAIRYFPKTGKLLELGAGQGQDSRYFAENGFEVTSTDISDSALEINNEKSREFKNIEIKKIDLNDELPFEENSFDVVYAHLSLHYFGLDKTRKILFEIRRVLKPGGVLAMFTNSINDPEYEQGEQIEKDYFHYPEVGAKKRFFSANSLRPLVWWSEIILLDEFGETYKDSKKGVHNLVRLVAKKPAFDNQFKMAIPFVGVIVEREKNGETEILMQTRWKPGGDNKYSGTLEFPAGVLDHPFENVFETMRKEVEEETGLEVDHIVNVDKTEIYSPQKDDASFAFRPFCCTQQLKEGKPWIGFIFICRVKDGEPKAQESETKDPKWMKREELYDLFKNHPEKIFALELPAFEYYFAPI